MELWKEINFNRAKQKYANSCEQNKQQEQRQINEIKTRQAIREYQKFEKIVKEI